MADDDDGGGGGGPAAAAAGGPAVLLTRRMGPFPVWVWFVLAGGAAYIMWRMGAGGRLAAAAGSSSGSSSGGPGAGTQFQSGTTQTVTDPATGKQTQTSYSASGDGYLPGFLTTAAGPMPYQQGDVYVNQNVSDTDPPPAPAAPANKTPVRDYVTVNSPPTSDGVTDNNANGLATMVYGLKSPDAKDALMGASQIINANPQIDWAKPVPAGTTVHIPLRWIWQGFEDHATAYNQGG